MAGKVTIGDVTFEALDVPGPLAQSVLTDPIVSQAIWRDVWAFDTAAGKGRALTKLTPRGAVPLPNGAVFFIPRALPGGAVGMNIEASRRMASRVLGATGAEDVPALLKAVSGAVQVPQKILPLDAFSRLEPVVSYVLKMHTDFAVVSLRNRAEDLSLYLCLPSRVSFHAEIRAVKDEDEWQRRVAETPALRTLQVSVPIPSKSPANAGLRRLALRRRIAELRQLRGALPEGTGGDVAGENLDRRIAAAQAEWDLLGAGA